jgi:hypothetical protein
MLISYLTYSSMESICSFETLVGFQGTTRRYIPEDGTLNPIITFSPKANRGFPHSLRENAGIIPGLGHNRFLADPFQFIIHQSAYPQKLNKIYDSSCNMTVTKSSSE